MTLEELKIRSKLIEIVIKEFKDYEGIEIIKPNEIYKPHKEPDLVQSFGLCYFFAEVLGGNEDYHKLKEDFFKYYYTNYKEIFHLRQRLQNGQFFFFPCHQKTPRLNLLLSYQEHINRLLNEELKILENEQQQ